MAFKGLEPKYNKLIDTDPQIKKVSMTDMDIAANKASMPKNSRNDETIRHVKG